MQFLIKNIVSWREESIVNAPLVSLQSKNTNVKSEVRCKYLIRDS
jgi:hypothetical protein